MFGAYKVYNTYIRVYFTSPANIASGCNGYCGSCKSVMSNYAAFAHDYHVTFK
jgi:hypothetical protein